MWRAKNFVFCFLLFASSSLFSQQADSFSTEALLLEKWTRANFLLNALSEQNKKVEALLQDSLKNLDEQKKNSALQQEELQQLKLSYEEAAEQLALLKISYEKAAEQLRLLKLSSAQTLEQLQLLKDDLQRAIDSGTISEQHSKELLLKLEEAETLSESLRESLKKLESYMSRLEKSVDKWRRAATIGWASSLILGFVVALSFIF